MACSQTSLSITTLQPKNAHISREIAEIESWKSFRELFLRPHKHNQCCKIQDNLKLSGSRKNYHEKGENSEVDMAELVKTTGKAKFSQTHNLIFLMNSSLTLEGSFSR